MKHVNRSTVRIPDELYKKLVKSAEENHRSINSEIIAAITTWVK